MRRIKTTIFIVYPFCKAPTKSTNPVKRRSFLPSYIPLSLTAQGQGPRFKWHHEYPLLLTLLVHLTWTLDIQRSDSAIPSDFSLQIPINNPPKKEATRPRKQNGRALRIERVWGTGAQRRTALLFLRMRMLNPRASLGWSRDCVVTAFVAVVEAILLIKNSLPPRISLALLTLLLLTYS